MLNPPMEDISLIGHNNPPSEIEILKQRLQGYELEKELERLSLRAIPAEIADDEQAGKISDYISAVKTAIDAVAKAHKKEKQPFWDAGKAADDWKNDLSKKFDALVSKASAPLLAWNRKKREEEEARQKQIAEEARIKAEQLAAQAEAHAKEGLQETADELLNAAIQEEDKAAMIQANSNVVEVKSRGSFSSSGLKQEKVVSIESRAALDLDMLRPYFKDEDLLSTAKRAVADGKHDIRGVKVSYEDKLTNRARR